MTASVSFENKEMEVSSLCALSLKTWATSIQIKSRKRRIVGFEG